ncbi:hypothetical protein ASG96_16330 [Terrabacter sp. Soil810]|nr:hypothetical protein ASG96_16330 [Terrabacter sp. Soil810]
MDTDLVGRQLLIPMDDIKESSFEPGSTSSDGSEQIDGSDAWILQQLGVPLATPNEGLLEHLMAKIAGKRVSHKTGFVAVESFCTAVRSLLPEVDGRDADEAIATWMQVTEELYFLYEESVIQRRLDDAFANRTKIDIKTFTSVASSVLNTRKSRAGGAFESHLSAVFRANGIAFTRVTKPLRSDKTKPDFLMPSLSLYQDDDFQTGLLSTVAAKRTLKERWLQVASEGKRIPTKHLATVDRDVASDTILGMPSHNIVLVMPRSLRDTRYWLNARDVWTLEDLLSMLLDKQAGAADLGYLTSFS